MTDPFRPIQDADARQDRAIRPIAERSILLVGMMGSGKSTVGRRLAARLGLPFYDADEEIEKAADLSISEIFQRYGEAHFRDGERRVITRLIDGPRCVIATGGGAFAEDSTRAEILARGLAIWLDVPIPVLVERVSRRNHRPLLHGRNPAEVIADLMDKRAPAYAEAHLRVRCDASPHARAVDAVLAAMKGLAP
jgi:shikimate kinase